MDCVRCSNCRGLMFAEPGDFWCSDDCKRAEHARLLGRDQMETRQRPKPARTSSVAGAWEVLGQAAESTFDQVATRNRWPSS